MLIAIDRNPYLKKRDIMEKAVPVKKSLPFVTSIRGGYVHRVRYVTMFTILGKSHLAVSCWCGMTQFVSGTRKAKLIESPDESSVMCATCEGRAIGAGLDGVTEINGRMVKFSPVKSWMRTEPQTTTAGT